MALSPTSSRGGAGTVTGVTAADTSIVVAGTAAAPTLATGTLDVIATNHPPTADVALNAKKITGLGTPTLSTDAVTKGYTDAAINGLDWKQAARLASAAALPANTYVNGASGVGATLTGNAFGALTIDGVAVAVNDRVLLKTEGTGSHNGIYSVTATGGGAAFYVLTRTADYNTTAEIVAGTGLYVTEGTANADTSWVMTTTGAVTVGTTALAFTQFGGGGSTPGILSRTITLSSAQILALGTTPVQIVPAPGALTIAVPIAASFAMHPGGTPYATNTVVCVGWAAFFLIQAAGVLNKTVAGFDLARAPDDGEDLSDVVNMPLLVGEQTGTNPTAGNGTCDVTVFYGLMTVSA